MRKLAKLAWDLLVGRDAWARAAQRIAESVPGLMQELALREPVTWTDEQDVVPM